MNMTEGELPDDDMEIETGGIEPDPADLSDDGSDDAATGGDNGGGEAGFVPVAADEAEEPSASDPLVRMVEALLFAAAEPLDAAQLADRLPTGTEIAPILAVIERTYAPRGVNLVNVAGRWTFRTAPDLAFLLRKDTHEQRKLSRAGVETLAIVAYHQPITRTEIEEIRGVAVSKGTIDVLMETGWITPRGRRQTPGKPLLFGTTDAFLDHFGLATIGDLPGLEELKAAGMLDPMAAAAPIAPEEGTLPEPPDDDDGPLDEPLASPLIDMIEDDDEGADGLNDGA